MPLCENTKNMQKYQDGNKSKMQFLQYAPCEMADKLNEINRSSAMNTVAQFIHGRYVHVSFNKVGTYL